MGKVNDERHLCEIDAEVVHLSNNDLSFDKSKGSLYGK